MIKIKYSQFQALIIKYIFVWDRNNPKRTGKIIIHEVYFLISLISNVKIKKNKAVFLIIINIK
jgi:hypothetical protein